jgi:hypothetical protein
VLTIGSTRDPAIVDLDHCPRWVDRTATRSPTFAKCWCASRVTSQRSPVGLIPQEIGDEKHALEAYRRALAIDPHLEHVEEAVKNLREKVEGRDI